MRHFGAFYLFIIQQNFQAVQGLEDKYDEFQKTEPDRFNIKGDPSGENLHNGIYQPLFPYIRGIVHNYLVWSSGI